jgi:hypothetical protein
VGGLPAVLMGGSVYTQLCDEIDRSDWRINGEEDDLTGANERVPDDAVLVIKEYGWGKTKQQFDKIRDVCGLTAEYDPLRFGAPVTCTVRNGSGAWQGVGGFPLHAYCRAVARFVVETKLNKKQVA